MPESPENLDFSKEENQKEFDNMPDEEKEKVKEEQQEEALAIHNLTEGRVNPLFAKLKLAKIIGEEEVAKELSEGIIKIVKDETRRWDHAEVLDNELFREKINQVIRGIDKVNEEGDIVKIEPFNTKELKLLASKLNTPIYSRIDRERQFQLLIGKNNDGKPIVLICNPILKGKRGVSGFAMLGVNTEFPKTDKWQIAEDED